MIATYQTHSSKGDNVARDKNVQIYINHSVKQQSTQLEFTIRGSISKVDAQKLNTIVLLLQQITEDPTLSVDYSEGQGTGCNKQIQLMFNGTEQGLKDLRDLYNHGKLEFYLKRAEFFR